MPALTRRRYPERPDCWRVYYDDVHVGTIARRVGIPNSAPPWGWSCGFYPGSHPGEFLYGIADEFETARVEFEAAWRIFSAKRSEADNEEWRHQRDWTARKYAMWEQGELLPSHKPDSTMRCVCGFRFDSHKPTESYDRRVHIYAAQAEGRTW